MSSMFWKLVPSLHSRARTKMATVVDNKVLAEAVRNYPQLYDKNSKNFKNRWEKISAWEEVAKETGLANGEAARVAFINLRTRFARNLKRRRNSKLKGVTPDSNHDDGAEDEELFPFLSWLETHIKSRQTYGTANSTTINVDAYGNDGHDDSEEDSTMNYEETARTSDVKTNIIRSSFQNKKKARFLKAKCRLNQELSLNPPAPFVPPRNPADLNTYEDQVFSAFIVSQLRHIPPHKKILLKMQISNLIYNEMLTSLPQSYNPTTLIPAPTARLQHENSDFSHENDTGNSDEQTRTVTTPHSNDVQQATVSLPSTAQPLQAVTIPLSDSIASGYSMSHVTVTLPQTVQPIQADHGSSVHSSWSRLHLQHARNNADAAQNKTNGY